jgi:hypothetical protein
VAQAPPDAGPPVNRAEPAPESDATAHRRRAGIGLLVSGTALVAAGVAVFVDAATLERRARAIAEDPPQGRQKEYIDEEVPRLERIRYAIAGPVLAGGVGLIVGGALLLRRGGSDRRTVLRPVLSPRQAGISVRVRF